MRTWTASARDLTSGPMSTRTTRRTAGRGLLARPRAVFRLLTDATAPRLPRLVALFTVLYVLMPIDFIPDVAPIIGWIDDLGIATLAVAYVAAAAARHERRATTEGASVGAAALT